MGRNLFQAKLGQEYYVIVVCPQEMKDYRGAFKIAAADKDKGGQEAARLTWQDRAKTFLMLEAHKPYARSKNKKLLRVKSYEWLLATDNMLQATAGCSWAFFQQPEMGPQHHPLSWPLCVVSPDQGTDGYCSLYFLDRGCRVNLDRAPDTSHGVWNDCRGAIKAIGKWPFMLLCTILFNLPHGPWNSDKFFVELKEAAKEYFQMNTNMACPVFQSIIHLLLRDRGWESRVGEEGIEEEL